MATQRVIDLVFFNKKEYITIEKPSNKKSILIYGGPLMANGITTSYINLVNHINKENYSVTIVIDPTAITTEELRIKQFQKFDKCIKVIPRTGRMLMTLEERRILKQFKDQKKFNNPELIKLYEKVFQREFKRVFGYGRFDNIINFEGYTEFWAALIGTKNQESIKNVIYQHNDMYGEWKLKHAYLETTFNLYYLYDRYASVSSQTKEENMKNLSQRFNIQDKNFIYCDNIQNPKEILSKAEKELEVVQDNKIFLNSIVFINIGRLSPEKGHIKLIKAFKKVSKIHPEAKLINLGDGVLRDEINTIIKTENLHDKVFFLGQRLNPYSYLQKAHCFILSSDHEGQPMTLFEAMILEKPIIAPDIVGNRSVLEERPGHLVENSENGLYQGMIDFLDGKYKNNETFDCTEYNQNALNMFYTKVIK